MPIVSLDVLSRFNKHKFIYLSLLDLAYRYRAITITTLFVFSFIVRRSIDSAMSICKVRKKPIFSLVGAGHVSRRFCGVNWNFYLGGVTEECIDTLEKFRFRLVMLWLCGVRKPLGFYSATVNLINLELKLNTSCCETHHACSIELHKPKIPVKFHIFTHSISIAAMASKGTPKKLQKTNGIGGYFLLLAL